MVEKEATTHVLVLCTDTRKQEDFKTLFGISGLSAEFAETKAEMFKKLGDQRTHVLLIAAGAESDEAIALCTTLKAPGSSFRDIPVVIVFDEDTPKEIALQSLHNGAYDYLIEPFNEIELLTKVAVLAKIKHAEDEFRQLAICDPLTGLFDRRYLYIRFAEEISRAKRYSRPISCLLFELQDLQKVNSEFGFEAGDFLLQLVGDSLASYKREIDVLSRLRGNEFVLVLYNTDRAGATILASRLEKRIANLKCKFDPAFQPGLKIGVVAADTSPDSVIHYQEMLDNAADALQDAKKSESDNIAIFGE